MNQLLSQGLGQQQHTNDYSSYLNELTVNQQQPKAPDNNFQPSPNMPFSNNYPQQQQGYDKMKPTTKPLQQRPILQQIPEQSESPPPKRSIKISDVTQVEQKQQINLSHDQVFKKNQDGMIVAKFEDIQKYQQSLQTAQLAPKNKKIFQIIEISPSKQ